MKDLKHEMTYDYKKFKKKLNFSANFKEYVHFNTAFELLVLRFCHAQKLKKKSRL